MTLDGKNFTTTSAMLPLFPMPTLWILAHEHVVSPNSVINLLRLGRASNEGFASVAELFFFASFLTKRAIKNKHAKLLVSDGSRAVLINQMACMETIQRERRIQWVWRIIGNSVGKH